MTLFLILAVTIIVLVTLFVLFYLNFYFKKRRVEIDDEEDFDQPVMCVTFEDPSSADAPKMDWRTRNKAILKVLDKHGIESALFVCGMRVDNPEGREIMRSWNDSGHIIANHSYQHYYYDAAIISIDKFSSDFLKCDELIKYYDNYRKYFRFPYLKEGNTKAKRDQFREFLKAHKYRIGHVTIDTSDWFIDRRLMKRLQYKKTAWTEPYREYYINHVLDRARYYRDLSIEVLGREVRHTLLLHHNLLNALFLDDLLKALRDDGWRIIPASDAFKDAVYYEAPDTLPAGESIIWALAKQTGEYDNKLRYPGEDAKYEEPKMDRLGL